MMKRIMKKFPFVLTALFLVALCGIGSSLAYLTASDTAVNEFPVGNVDSSIEEDFPETNVTPETILKKEVKVVNDGNLTSWVRCRLLFSNSASKSLTELQGLDEALWYYDSASDFYYYKKTVAPGEATAALITGVKVVTESENYSFEDLTDFDITVYAELFQHYDHEGSCAEDEYLTSWERGAE